MHYHHAQQWSKALMHFELSAQEANRLASNESARRAWVTAIDLLKKLNEAHSPRMERCLVKLARTLYNMGRYSEALANFERAIAMHGVVIPDTKLGLQWTGWQYKMKQWFQACSLASSSSSSSSVISGGHVLGSGSPMLTLMMRDAKEKMDGRTSVLSTNDRLVFMLIECVTIFSSLDSFFGI